MTASAVAPGLLTLLQLEREARHAQTLDGFRFTVTNRTRILLPCRQAVLMRWSEDFSPRVEAVSDVPSPDANAPFVRWVGEVARQLTLRDDSRRVHVIDSAGIAERERSEWVEWSSPAVLWVPLLRPDGQPMGVLWLARDDAWGQDEAVLAERLGDTYGHAWWALSGAVRTIPPWVRNKRLWLGGAAAVALLLLAPVRLSALAPAEVVAAEPFVVAAPIDGVIARFLVRPNEVVAEGQPLLAFDDTDLRARHEVAAEELAVTLAELRKAEQGALSDAQSAGQMALLRAQSRLKEVELAHAAERLGRTTVKAERAGAAVFRNVNDWIGRPVRTGERILLLADPTRLEVEARLPVSDAIVLEPGAGIVVFLDADPLAPVSARLAEAAYEAELSEDGILAYRVRGVIEGAARPSRLGLRGTARIDGPRVPLFLFLFRRPIAAARHMLGL